MQEARKRFDKASLTYDQVGFISEKFAITLEKFHNIRILYS